jgi:hypothetical protein
MIAAAGSDWNAGGSIMTFYFPVGLFVVVVAILSLLLGRPHKRVPGRRVTVAAHAGLPDAGAARAASVAAGLPTAAGGGSVESAAEPAGASLEASADSGTGNGNAAGPDAEPGGGAGPADETSEGTEDSE